MNNELKSIKKLYGEEMMHLCRELFPSLLEKEGILIKILSENLAPTHSFAKDIKEKDLYVEFKNWIYSFINVEEKNQTVTDKTPFELMDEAGYTLYECKSEEDIQRFKHFYRRDEELCTFRGGRLQRCHVFFAVKKNADQIKRSTNPSRQDLYGTSVISIQFGRGDTNDLSIKNRYNHTVINPDATYSNNLENIIPGLTKSFEKNYNLKIRQDTNESADFLTGELDYVKAKDGKYYRYNIEVNDIYYCENNIIIKYGEIITTYADNPERYILMDQYIVDLKQKTIVHYEGHTSDTFIDSIRKVGNINQIEVTKNGNTRRITFIFDNNKQVHVDVNNCAIVGYENEHITTVGAFFLYHNRQIKYISLPKVKYIDNYFLDGNVQLKSISLPEVEKIGSDFLYCNECLDNISLPKVRGISQHFLYHNKGLKSISFPELEETTDNFLAFNEELSSVSLPKVKKIGYGFLNCNEKLKSISLPEVEVIESNFIYSNGILNNISLPKVKRISSTFLRNNEELERISLPKVKRIEDAFLSRNRRLKNVSLPEVEIIGDYFLWNNRELKSISLPKVEIIGDNFLHNNEEIDTISLPQIRHIGNNFITKRSIFSRYAYLQSRKNIRNIESASKK